MEQRKGSNHTRTNQPIPIPTQTNKYIFVMISIILVDKHGVEKEKQIKSALFSLDAVYKYAGFRKGDGFAHRHSWKMNDGTYLSCYGKIEGMANNENKYELPPPIDNALFFGSLVLIHAKQTLKNVENTGNIKELLMDMSVKQYKEYYDELFGGFDDIETHSNDEGDGDGDGDGDDDDELENVDPKMLTKEGYLKDDFIVDSEEEGDGDDDDDDGHYSLECESKTKIKTKPKRIVKGTSKKTREDTNKTISTKPSILKNVGKSKLIQSETLKKEVHKNKQSKLSKALDSDYECEGESENTIDDEYYDSELEEETYIQE